MLLFEDEFGKANEFQVESLSNIRSPRNIELVFISACHSEMIGQKFIDMGVEHVVCVKKDDKVIDNIAVKFTDRFYKNVTDQTQRLTICEAFKMTQQNLRQEMKDQISEIDKIILLHGHENKQCMRRLRLFPEGKLQCLSEHKLLGPKLLDRPRMDY